MIIYALISRSDGTVLTESTTSGIQGNFPQVTRVLLDRLKDDPNKSTSSSDDGYPSLLANGSRRTFSHDNSGKNGDDEENWWGSDSFPTMCIPSACSDSSKGMGPTATTNYFHVLREYDIIYLCLSDDVPGTRHKANFSFLEEIKTTFQSQYTLSKIRKANAYGMDKSFAPTLRTTMHSYNTNPHAGKDPKVAALAGQIDDLKSVMGKNIQMVLTRGENLEKLLEQSDYLEGEAAVFAKKSETLMKKSRYENGRWYFYGVLLLLIVVYVIVSFQCGWTFDKCISGSE